jgi:autotransporter family porin
MKNLKISILIKSILSIGLVFPLGSNVFAADAPTHDVPKVPAPTAPQHFSGAGSYLANLAASNTMFVTRLHDRLGETQYTDALTGERKVTSLWMRHVGGHNRFHDRSGQVSTTGNRYVVQLGGDLAQWSSDGLDRYHLGVMTGYANNHSRSHSTKTRYSSTGIVDGYSAGLYGTWYANQVSKAGAYFDSWVLYNWFDNEMNGQLLNSKDYKSKGFTAAIEGGYSFKVGASDHTSYWLQPKAQIVWMDVTADDHREASKTWIKHDTNGNVMTSLGLRAYASGHNAIDDGKNREFEPFIELNWIHNTENHSVLMNSVSTYQNGTKDQAEVKGGIEGKLNNHLTGWANISHQFGSHSYGDTQGMIGVKYSF